MGLFRNYSMRKYLNYHHQLGEKLRLLQSTETLNNSSLVTLQQDCLQKLILHAYHEVPYYHRLFSKHGVVKRHGQLYSERFADIPILDKATIRKFFDELKSDDLRHRKWYYDTSGGSTGEPVRFIQDQHFARWTRAVQTLFDQWAGYSIGYPVVLLWGSEKDILESSGTLHSRLGQWFRNECWLNAFHMTRSQMRTYITRMSIHKPWLVLAYVESLYDLARFIEAEHLDVYSPKSIIVSAGTLSSEMRETIERVFRAPVYNRYGSREVGSIACECDQHKGLHVSPYTQYVEILNEDEKPTTPGEIGEVVVTCLVNRAMPLIRYRIGDMAAWATEPCTCGRAWPLLKEISGRVTDLFITQNGARVYGGYFRQLLYFKDWVERYQVIQESVDSIRICLVLRARGENTDKYSIELENVKKKIRRVMGHNCSVEFEFVDNIAPTASGKYRYMISKVGDKATHCGV